MWFLKIMSLLIMLSLAACAPPPMIVEMAVLPHTPATAKIKQLAGKVTNQNPPGCSLPCSIKVEKDSNYEVSFDGPGYYPVIVQFDWAMAYREQFDRTATHNLNKSKFSYHTPLIIPLIKKRDDRPS